MLRRAALVLGCLALACSAGCYDTAVLDAQPEPPDAAQASDAAQAAGCDPACALGQRCDLALRACVPCTDDDRQDDDGACGGGSPFPPFCDPTRFACVPCRRSADCGDAGGLCFGGICRACRDDRDCPFGQRCEHDGDRCVVDNRGPGDSDDRDPP
jgi:hypothetical protein